MVPSLLLAFLDWGNVLTVLQHLPEHRKHRSMAADKPFQYILSLLPALCLAATAAQVGEDSLLVLQHLLGPQSTA